MKSTLLFILLIFYCTLPVNAELLTGEIKYDSQSAKEYLISTPKETISNKDIQTHYIDINKNDNIISLLQGNTQLTDRTLAYFSDGSYGIIYKTSPKNVWYYNSDGILTHSEIKSSLNYPYKTYKYTPNGKLVNMSLRVSKDETFIYTPHGELIAHWQGQYCYDKNNNIIMSRKIYE